MSQIRIYDCANRRYDSQYSIWSTLFGYRVHASDWARRAAFPHDSHIQMITRLVRYVRVSTTKTHTVHKMNAKYNTDFAANTPPGAKTSETHLCWCSTNRCRTTHEAPAVRRDAAAAGCFFQRQRCRLWVCFVVGHVHCMRSVSVICAARIVTQIYARVIDWMIGVSVGVCVFL